MLLSVIIILNGHSLVIMSAFQVCAEFPGTILWTLFITEGLAPLPSVFCHINNHSEFSTDTAESQEYIKIMSGSMHNTCDHPIYRLQYL